MIFIPDTLKLKTACSSFQLPSTHLRKNLTVENLIVSVLYILILLLSPILVFLTVFLVLLRSILTFYKKTFKPDYGEFLCGFANLFSSDPLYTKPTATIVSYIIIKGHVSLEDARTQIGQKIAEFDRKCPEPWFPEVKQWVTTWMGFSVLKQELNFQVRDHVRMLSEVLENGRDEIRAENAVDVAYDLSRVPFTMEKSPWDILLYHNNGDNNNNNEEGDTIIFERVHHSLADGLSFIRLCGHFCNAPDTFDSFMKKYQARREIQEGKKRKRTTFGKIQNFLSRSYQVVTFPFLGLYQTLVTLVRCFDMNSWHESRFPVELRQEFAYHSFEPVQIDRLRGIRKRQGDAKLFSVILTAVTASLRDFMISRGEQVPPTLHASVSIPVPKSNIRLSNNVTCTLCTLPTGLSHPKKILREVEREWREIRTSRYPYIMLAVGKFLGLFPKGLLMSTWFLTTVTATNIPGYDNPISFCKKPVEKVYTIAGPPKSTAGVYVWVLGYNGQLFINLGMSQHIVREKEELNKISESFMRQLKVLEL